MAFRPIHQAFGSKEAAEGFAENLLAAGWNVDPVVQAEGKKEWFVHAYPTPETLKKKRGRP